MKVSGTEDWRLARASGSLRPRGDSGERPGSLAKQDARTAAVGEDLSQLRVQDDEGRKKSVTIKVSYKENQG